ncbi:protein of unknown function DUF262 [Nitrosococcus watsonii C-113]|uniref:DUF262 domain-containing protein n=2 Tax=Nitrosococcus TaxID=1227 RepID=D8K9B0_NITWC|nr:protein of unknown function DUF262 [Nitrosococcus watsonii C-113]
MTLHSRLLTLQDIDEHLYFFTVPLYQRLYVWGKDQIDTLLEDVLAAYQQGEEMLYLGTTLVVERESNENGTTFDLIDGQQRLTTLWMMSLVWREQEAMQRFLYHQDSSKGPAKRPRLTFAIRQDINTFFAERIEGKESRCVGSPPIEDALATLESFVEAREPGLDLPRFTRFLFEKVKLVLTQVPPHTDLNKLFEVINHRGLQLQHHQILKARLLRQLSDTTERQRYALLWEACADMSRYVEKNLKDLTRGSTQDNTPFKISDLYEDKAGAEGREDLASAEKVLEALAGPQATAEEDEPLSLAAILKGATGSRQDKDSTPPAVDNEHYESDEVRSIISFPLLLQHTLRIWLQRQGKADLPRILDKDLLRLFDAYFLQEGASGARVKSFIELLWEIRYCLDKHVIKWVNIGEEERHLIYRLRKSCSLVRDQPERNEGFALLQSMLYHSQQITTHYWLTPLLAWLHRYPGKPSQHYAYLRHLDNHLLCAADERSLIERTRDFLDNPWHRNPLDCHLLEENLGTHFPHYWFYKMEFVLWYLKSPQMKEKDPRRDNFRMTAKNSVEHISPQTAHEADFNTVSEEVLDTFGNLALVSRSINSEYGNKPFNEKRLQFLNRNRDRLDSLKMALIYENTEWNDGLAKAHQSEMMALMESYLAFDHRGQAGA